MIAHVAAAVLASGAGAGPQSAAAPEPRALLVTETAGFRHASIPAARAALQRLGRASAGYDVVALGSSRALTPAALRGARAVVFLSTTGELRMGAPGRARLLRWIRAGGSFVGLHAASNTFARSDAFARMLGARFRAHPFVGRGRVIVEDRAHPATRRLPAAFGIDDEFYVFQRNPRARVRVLARRAAPRDEPLVWSRREGRGRVLYSALGHPAAAWRHPLHLRLLGDGLRWATAR